MFDFGMDLRLFKLMRLVDYKISTNMEIDSASIAALDDGKNEDLRKWL